jgi:hypothetical protein
MNIFQEINEARMTKRLDDFRGESANTVAQILFDNLLALQILAQTKPNRAADYARDVMTQQQFDRWRINQPDLYNLIVLVLNQDKYSDIILQNKNIVVPELRFKRNIREIASGRIDNQDFTQLMLILQNRISGISGYQANVRRAAGDWDSLTASEQQIQIRNLLQHMNTYRFNSDLYTALKRLT